MRDSSSDHVRVLKDLRRGFGVEDIALRTDLEIARVRTIIADLRMWGLLAQIDWREVSA